jgi:hypothetical protein
VGKHDPPKPPVDPNQAVPRHRYIPDVIYRYERGHPGNDLVPLHRAAEPERWLEMVYSDIPINTQVDDGKSARPLLNHRW